MKLLLEIVILLFFCIIGYKATELKVLVLKQSYETKLEESYNNYERLSKDTTPTRKALSRCSYEKKHLVETLWKLNPPNRKYYNQLVKINKERMKLLGIGGKQ